MHKKIIALTSVLLVLFLSLTITSLAWFSNSHNFTPDASGSAVTGYFYAGDGSKEHPYQINSPIHVYNLAWLQYMGYLNEEEDGTITQLYFEIIEPVKEPGEEQDGKIDMEGIVLPPIGTTVNPFVGHFNGNGYCISNLTVSNYLDGENDELKIVERPLSVTDISEAVVSVVGFFGVVGDIDGRLDGKLAKDGNEVDIRNKVNAVHDLYLENLTIRTETATSLIGLVAGYANGSIINVGVSGESELQLGSEFEDGLTVEDVFDMQYVASAYSLIGKYNADNIVWEDIPIPDDGLVDDDDQDGLGWGGSINMRQLRQRIAYIAGSSGLTTIKGGTNPLYGVSNVFGFSGTFTANQWNTVAGNYALSNRNPDVSLTEGTMMPLSVTEDVLTGPEEAGVSDLKTLPYYKKSENKTANVEAVSKSNSGYVVGGGSRESATDYSNAYINYKSEYVFGNGNNSRTSSLGIVKSVGTAYNMSGRFPANNLHLLTVNVSDGLTYVISDDNNASATTWLGSNYTRFARYDTDFGFQKYEDVRDDFVADYSGQQYIHGIQFNPKINISGVLSHNSASTVNATGVTLFGNTISGGYEMIKGAINFSLRSAGFVTTVLGTYGANNAGGLSAVNGKDHTLFSIFEVTRDKTTNQITGCRQIMTIHEKINSQGKIVDYVYNLTDQEKDSNYSYNLVFNYNTMSTLTEVAAAYYFEIPLKKGDYAIGSSTNDSAKTGAYLLYLDIGANGDQSIGEDDEGDGGEGVTESMHTIYGVTFIPEYDRADALSAIDGEEVLSDRYTVITFELKLTDTSNDHSGLSVKYERTQTEMIWTETDSSGAFKVTPLKDKEDPTALSPPG